MTKIEIIEELEQIKVAVYQPNFNTSDVIANINSLIHRIK